DDLPTPGQRVQPAPGRIEFCIPCSVVDRPALESTTSQIPVVVLGRAGLVVVDHGAAEVMIDLLRRRGDGDRAPLRPLRLCRWCAGSATRCASLVERLMQ